MGKVKNLRHPFSLSYKKNNGKSHYKKNGNGNENSKKPMSHKVLFEPLEPRVLLAADLTVSNLFAHEYGVQPGETLTIDFSILNNGDAAADATRYGIVWSADENIDDQDRLLDSQDIASLVAGSAARISSSLNIPGINDIIVGNTYWINVIADYDGVVTEGNESNNISSVKVKVLDSSAVEKEGKTGDVLEIDLSSLGTLDKIEDIKFNLISSNTGSELGLILAPADNLGDRALTMQNGTRIGNLVLGERDSTSLFPVTSNSLYFVPELQWDTTNAWKMSRGFEGLIEVTANNNKLYIDIGHGYSTDKNKVELTPKSNTQSTLQTLRAQQRLKYLGFSGKNGTPLNVDGLLGDSTKWGISLFNYAINNSYAYGIWGTLVLRTHLS